MDNSDLKKIFNGSQNAIKEMEKVFSEHKDLETVIVNPDSWVGKELLIQTKRLIDIRRDVDSLTASINRVERMLGKLMSDSKE